MFTCPNCHQQITRQQVQEGRCPECQGLIPEQDSRNVPPEESHSESESFSSDTIEGDSLKSEPSADQTSPEETSSDISQDAGSERDVPATSQAGQSSQEPEKTLADLPVDVSAQEKTLVDVTLGAESDPNRAPSDQRGERALQPEETASDLTVDDSAQEKTLVDVTQGAEGDSDFTASTGDEKRPLGLEKTLQDAHHQSLGQDHDIGQTIAVPDWNDEDSVQTDEDGNSKTRDTNEIDRPSANRRPSSGSSSLIVKARSVGGLRESQSGGSDFQILEALGQGGVGVVYSARQASIDRAVALKKLHSHLAGDADHRNKFLAEAVIIGDLDHPQIVPIYDLGKNDKDELFYTMKRVEGTPWSEKIDKLPLEENLSILLKICEAIAFAHFRGVVHRDLKPENVMLGDFGEVLVMDWGLALLTEESSKRESITESGSLGGTPAYMAPEMVSGPIEKIGYHSDIYLLGAQLFRILTGKTPHTGKTVMACVKNAALNAIEPTDVSGELMEIALKAMASRPEDRYSSALEFRDALKNYESHAESLKLNRKAEQDLAHAKESGDYELFARAVFGFEEAITLWSSNSAAQEGQLLAKEEYAQSALVNGDFDLGLSLLDREEPRHLPLVRKLEEELNDRNTRQRQLQRTKRVFRWATFSFILILSLACSVIYVKMRTAEEATLQANEATRKEGIAKFKAQQATEKEKQTNLELASTNLELKEEKERFRKAKEQAELSERIAKNNRRLADENRKDAEAQTYLAQIALAAKKIEENRFDEAREILGAYQGSHLVGWEWGYLWDFCNLAEVDRKVGTVLQDVAASQDGVLFAVAADDGRVRIWKTADFLDPQQPEKVPLWEAPPHPGIVSSMTSVEFSPDRSLLAVGDSRGDVTLFNISENLRIEPLPDLPQPWESQAPISSLRFSYSENHSAPTASTRWLLVGSESGEAAVWDLTAEAWLQFPRGLTLRGHRREVRDIVASPDQSFILTAGEDDKIQIWSNSLVDSTQPVSQVEDPGASQAVELYEIWKTVYWMHEGAVLCLDTAVDDRGNLLVASGGRDGSIHIWSLDDVPSNNLTTNPRRTTVLEPANNAAVQDLHFFRRQTGDPEKSDLCLLACGDDRTVQLWKVNTRNLFAYRSASTSRLNSGNVPAASLERRLRGHGSRVTACHLITVDEQRDPGVPANPLIVSVGEDQRVMLWNPKDYSEHEIFEGEPGSQILDSTFDHDSDQIASVTSKGVLSITDLHSRRSILVEDRVLPSETAKEGHDYLANKGQFVPTRAEQRERYYLTAGIDGKVIVWDLERGISIAEFNQSGRTSVMALSPDAKRLVTGGTGSTAWIGSLPDSMFDPSAPEAENTPMIKLSGHKDVVTAACFSPDGNWILTGDKLGELRVWHNPSGIAAENDIAAVHSLQAHSEEITEILSYDGFIITASKDYAIKIWRLSENEQSDEVSLVQERRLRGTGEVTQASISPQGDYFACVRQQFEQHDSPATSPSKTEQKLILNSEITVYDLTSDPPREWTLTKTDSLILATDFFPDRKWLLLTENNGRVWLWNWEKREERLLEFGEEIENYCTRVDSSGSRLVTTGGRQVRVWSFDPKRLAVSPMQSAPGSPPWLGPHYGISHVSFSVDDSWIVTGDRNGNVKLWQRPAGQETFHLQYRLPVLTNRFVVATRFSPRAPQTLLTAWENMLILWTFDGDKWSEQKRIVLADKTGVSSVNYSPSGRKLVVGRQDGTCEVWDATELSRDAVMRGNLQHHQPINCGIFSTDETLIVTGCDDKDARGILWKLQDGQWTSVTDITGHSDGITSVAFSPIHQLRLLTGSRDGTAKLWDISHWTATETDQSAENENEQKTIKELLTLRGHVKEITAVDFDHTGQFLLTASRDGKTIRWSSSQIDPAVVAMRDFVDLLPGKPVHICREFKILDPVLPDLEGGTLDLSVRPVSGMTEFWNEIPPTSVTLESEYFRLERGPDNNLFDVTLQSEDAAGTRKKIGTVIEGSLSETELSLPLELEIEPGSSHLELMDFLHQLVCTPQIPDEQAGPFELVVRLRLELPQTEQGPTQEAFVTLRINVPENESKEANDSE